MKTIHSFIVRMVFLGGLALMAASCQHESGPAAAAAISPRAGADMAMAQVLKDQKLSGKVTLVQFGEVGCKLSEEGLGRMQWVQNNGALPELGLLRVEGNPNAAAVAAYYQGKQLKFGVVPDAGAALAKATGATAVPTFLLVDKYGHVRYRGGYPEERLDEWVKVLSSEKADGGSDAPMLGAKDLDPRKLLPSTKLPALEGEAKALSEYMGEAGVLIVFVDTSCPFSAKAMQDLPKVAPKLAALKIPTVLVNLDDAADAVKTHYAETKLGLPIHYDVTTATKTLWGVESVPTLMYVSPEMQVAYRGPAVWKDLAAGVEKSGRLAAGSVQLEATGTEFG